MARHNITGAAQLRQALGHILAREDWIPLLVEHSPSHKEEYAEQLRRAILILQWVHHAQTGEMVDTTPPAMARDALRWIAEHGDEILKDMQEETDPAQIRENQEMARRAQTFLGKLAQEQRAWNAAHPDPVPPDFQQAFEKTGEGGD